MPIKRPLAGELGEGPAFALGEEEDAGAGGQGDGTGDGDALEDGDEDVAFDGDTRRLRTILPTIFFHLPSLWV